MVYLQTNWLILTYETKPYNIFDVKLNLIFFLMNFITFVNYAFIKFKIIQLRFSLVF